MIWSYKKAEVSYRDAAASKTGKILKLKAQVGGDAKIGLKIQIACC